jgi:transcriptional regulator with XRE-family HTH domain
MGVRTKSRHCGVRKGEQLAELLGVSPQAVSKWENGKNLPETALLPKLVSAESVLRFLTRLAR